MPSKTQDLSNSSALGWSSALAPQSGKVGWSSALVQESGKLGWSSTLAPQSGKLGWSSALALQSGKHGGKGASAPAVFSSKLRHALHLLRLTLCEIFDERAYDRYLARTNAPRGRASYRAFTTERSALTARKPRCC